MLSLVQWLYDRYNRRPLTFEEKFEQLKAYYERRRKEMGESTDEDDDDDKKQTAVKIGSNQLFESRGKIQILYGYMN